MPTFSYAIPTLGSTDVAAASRFWSDTLGFTAEFGDNEFAGLNRDEVSVFITRVEDPSVPHNIMAWIATDDVEALHAEWSAVLSTDYAGTTGAAMTALTDTSMGREFAVRDPAGNCVHFFTEA